MAIVRERLKRSGDWPIAGIEARWRAAIARIAWPGRLETISHDPLVVIDVGHTIDVPGALSARGMPEYAFNLQLGKNIKQALNDAGFDKTTLLITGKAPPMGLVERAVIANRIPADLFLSIHHDSVPDNLIHTWQYDGQDQQYNDDYPGYALFVSNDNPEHAASLLFGKFLGKALQAHGLQFTPHYTLPLMGNRRRVLVDAEAGVYRYDQLIVLRSTVYPGVTESIADYLAARGRKTRVAFCPERIVQGFAVEELQTLPQIVSGMTPEAEDQAAELFALISPEIIRLTTREAEMVKLFNNAYRYIQFAVANQFYFIAESAGVEIERERP